MFDFLFYVILSLSLFGSVLVKVIVSQWKISQTSSFAHNADYSKELFFFIQIFESFFNSKFNIFAFINLCFALSCQTIISTIQFFLDGLTANQKSEAKKKFVSMILKDLFFPLFFLARYFIEYSYSTSFMLIFPIPFLIRYLAFLTRSFIDGLSISSKAKERKFHQKLFAFQIGLFTISYIFFILFLNYYFYPDKFTADSENSKNDSNFFKSSLHRSLVSNLSHESKLRQNLQYIIEQIASLKIKRIQKKELDKRIKDEKNKDTNLGHNDINPDIIDKKQSEKELEIKTNDEKSDKTENKNSNQNDNSVSTESKKENTETSNDFYSSDDIILDETSEIRSSIFLFLSFQCCFALIDIAYDVVRHIIFVSDIENDGTIEKSIKHNYINDIVFEVLKIVCELTFFFMHVIYVIINLNSTMPSFKKISKIREMYKQKTNLNISSNSTLIEIPTINPIDSFSEIPSFQKEIIGIALYTPIFVMRSIILNTFFLTSKIISFKKWKQMSNAIKNNLPDAEEEDMRHEMRCIICRLEMCTCKRKSANKNRNSNQKRKIKRKVKKLKNSNFKENSTFPIQNNEYINSNINHEKNTINNTNANNYNINRNETNDTNNIVNNLNDEDNNNNLNSSNENEVEYEYEYEYDFDESSSNNNEDNIEYVIRKGDIKKLPCGHCFHAQCLQNWTQRQMKCPLCQYDMKNILNRTLMLINQLQPEFLRNINNRADIQDIQREVAPNIFIPHEFIREAQNREHDENDIINLDNNRRNEDFNENDHIRALRILTHTMLVLTFILLVVLIALIATMLLDIVDL